MSDRPLSEQVRKARKADVHLGLLGDEIAALEAERDELRNLLFVDRDEWRRFRVHGDTVLALEAVTAERDRLRTALESISEGGYDEAYRIADAALEGGDDE